MSDIIFAKPVHLYESYSDLWRIVELSGYPIITIGDIDPASDNCYLFSTPDTHWHDGTERRGWPDARARIIYFNIEWYMDVDYSAIPGVEVWSADQWHAEKTNTRYIPLGSHPGLKSYPESPNGKVYDVVTLWASSFNRYRGLGQLREHNVALAPNGWGDERHDSLMRSRVMCHVHQWPDKPTCAPQRFCVSRIASIMRSTGHSRSVLLAPGLTASTGARSRGTRAAAQVRRIRSGMAQTRTDGGIEPAWRGLARAIVRRVGV